MPSNIAVDDITILATSSLFPRKVSAIRNRVDFILNENLVFVDLLNNKTPQYFFCKITLSIAFAQ